ncbi:hypothetical protein COO60DRAFT_1496816 [Scenedesmus sp. NREL 46B-D3]|nr:hypothetical protein COO60DRAFT_1496816 [Scenedesmus sp. NREL 46B-D3]
MVCARAGRWWFGGDVCKRLCLLCWWSCGLMQRSSTSAGMCTASVILLEPGQVAVSLCAMPCPCKAASQADQLP